MKLACSISMQSEVDSPGTHRSVSDINFDIHIDSHPTIDMETSSSSSGLTNTETGTDTNEQVLPCYNNQGIVAACASDTTDYPDSIDSEECEYSQRSQLTSSGMEDRYQYCECKRCRDYSTSNQPVAVAMSKVLHSHHSKEKNQIC